MYVSECPNHHSRQEHFLSYLNGMQLMWRIDEKYPEAVADSPQLAMLLLYTDRALAQPHAAVPTVPKVRRRPGSSLHTVAGDRGPRSVVRQPHPMHWRTSWTPGGRHRNDYHHAG